MPTQVIIVKVKATEHLTLLNSNQ